jgi:hypothetical protein
MVEMLLAHYLNLPFLMGLNGIVAVITCVIAAIEDITERTTYLRNNRRNNFER